MSITAPALAVGSVFPLGMPDAETARRVKQHGWLSAGNAAAWVPQGSEKISAMVVPARSDDDAAHVTRQQAASILDQLLGAIRQPRPLANAKDDAAPMPDLTLPVIETLHMNSMFSASMLLVGQMLGDLAQTKGEMIDILSKKQEDLRNEEVRIVREQMEKAIEQQNKAQKAGILGAVLDWVVAAITTVVGVIKTVAGVMTGNPMLIAGGAMDVMAGMAGVGKAICNTMALVDPANAEKYHSAAQKFGYAEIAFSVAGAAIDITSALRSAIVSKVIPKVTGEVMGEAAGSALKQAISTGDGLTASLASRRVAKEVAGQIGNQVVAKLGAEVTENMVKEGAKIGKSGFISHPGNFFSQQAIEKMVLKSVKKTALDMIRGGKSFTAEEISKHIVEQLRKDVLKAVFKMASSGINITLNVSRSFASGSQQIAIGVLEMQKASLQREIDYLMLDQEWLRSLFQFFQQQKEEAIEKVRELHNDKAAMTEDGAVLMSQNASSQAQMAASMV